MIRFGELSPNSQAILLNFTQFLAIAPTQTRESFRKKLSETPKNTSYHENREEDYDQAATLLRHFSTQLTTFLAKAMPNVKVKEEYGHHQ